MSPGTRGRHAKHRSGVRMDELLESMEEDPEYVQLVTQHQRRFRIAPQDMVAFTDQLCQICIPLMASAGAGAPEVTASKMQRLQRDLKHSKEELKTQLVQCNLNALKQLDLVKGGTGEWDDKVVFYEPMKYLNEDEKDLVFMVVKDKLRQILDGTAPDSFMGKLKASLGMADPGQLLKKASKSKVAVEEQEEEEDDFSNEAVEIARNAAKKSQEAAALAQRETEESKKRLMQLQQQLDERGVELMEAQQLLAQGERYRQQLLLAMDRMKGQELEPEEASFVMSELSKSTEGFQVVIEELPEDCSFLEVAQWHESAVGPGIRPIALELHHDARRRKSSVLCKYREEHQAEAAVQKLTGNSDSTGRWSKVRARLLPSQQKATVSPQATLNRSRTGESWRSKSKGATRSWSQGLRKHGDPPAEVPEPEVTRQDSPIAQSRQVTRSKSTVKLEESQVELVKKESQAEISKKSKKIEELTEENKKLKVCLEELQAKLRQLMGKSKERGIGDEISEIANDLGLKRVLSCPSRFDILYQDAFKRIERLEELRAKIREERSRWLQGPTAAPAEPSVLTLVERSPLVILQQLLTTGPAGWSLASSHSPKRSQRPRPPALEPEPPVPGDVAGMSPSVTSKSLGLKLPRLGGPVLKESASTPCLRATPMRWEAERRGDWKQMDSRRVLV